jgi:hypothetical protein
MSVEKNVTVKFVRNVSRKAKATLFLLCMQEGEKRESMEPKRIQLNASLSEVIKILKDLHYIVDKNRIDKYPDRKIHHMYRYLGNNERYHIKMFNKCNITYLEIHRDENFGKKSHDIRVYDKRISKEVDKIERKFLENNIGII